jgi:hypothetical protein
VVLWLLICGVEEICGMFVVEVSELAFGTEIWHVSFKKLLKHKK